MGSLGDLKKHMFFVVKLWKTENIEFLLCLILRDARI